MMQRSPTRRMVLGGGGSLAAVALLAACGGTQGAPGGQSGTASGKVTYMSQGTDPADELRIRAALRGASQEDLNTYFDARYGSLPREAFFNPENLQRLMTNAPAGVG